MERTDVGFAHQRGAVRLYALHLRRDRYRQHLDAGNFRTERSEPVGPRQYLAVTISLSPKWNSDHLVQSGRLPYQTAYAGVTGLGYSSYENVYNTAGALVAAAQDMTNGSGNLLLSANGLAISSSSGQLRVTSGADTFNLNAHSTEAISATGLSSETFKYASGFGPKHDNGPQGGRLRVIQLNLSMSSGLSSSNTAAQDLASLFLERRGRAIRLQRDDQRFGRRRPDSAGVTTATLSTNANSVFKFV